MKAVTVLFLVFTFVIYMAHRHDYEQSSEHRGNAVLRPICGHCSSKENLDYMTPEQRGKCRQDPECYE